MGKLLQCICTCNRAHISANSIQLIMRVDFWLYGVQIQRGGSSRGDGGWPDIERQTCNRRAELSSNSGPVISLLWPKRSQQSFR